MPKALFGGSRLYNPVVSSRSECSPHWPMTQMITLHNPRLHRVLFLLQAPLWVLIGILFLVRYRIRAEISNPVLLGAGIILYGFWLAFLGYHLGRKSKTAYLLALPTLLAAILVGFADDFGAADLLFFLYNAFLLAALILAWRTYWKQKG